MSFLFPKPKKPKIVALPKQEAAKPIPVSPAAVPEKGIEATDWESKKAVRRSGFRKTIITGNLEPVNTGKKQLLG